MPAGLGTADAALFPYRSKCCGASDATVFDIALARTGCAQRAIFIVILNENLSVD